MSWNVVDMPSLEGQVWVVTGANSGLGLETARALAARGAAVVMGCRDEQRAEAAAADVRRTAPRAQLELERLDLASLASVEAFSGRVRSRHPALDGLVNNAGIMAIPRALTADGFELQLGTNHLGHFALALRLLPALEAARAPRLVSVASSAHRMGVIRFDDLMGERAYSPWGAYGQSKLANLLFTLELERRLTAAGRRTLAVAAHPGYSATNLMGVGPRLSGSRVTALVMQLGNALVGQSPAMGALPILFAATAPEVRGGEYYGPDGLFELFGYPQRCGSSRRARDPEAAQRLWEVSEQLTGARFDRC